MAEKKQNGGKRPIDLHHFSLLAECNCGNLVFHDLDICKGEGDVYAFQFGEELYIGSSCRVARRVKGHCRELCERKHKNTGMQDLYNKTRSFRVYIIFRCNIERPNNNLKIAEHLFIRLLQPSLNRSFPCGDDHYNKIVWSGTSK